MAKVFDDQKQAAVEHYPGLDCACSRHLSNVFIDTPISEATTPTLALSGGNNRATALFLVWYC